MRLNPQRIGILSFVALSAFTTQAASAAPSDLATLQAQVKKLQAENKALRAKSNTGTKARQKSSGFTDIAGLPSESLITQLQQVGVFKGMGSEFYPDRPITRGEFAAWVVNSFNLLHPKPAQKIRFAPQLAQQFKDLPPSHPYYKYVQALANAGYSVGYDDQTYRPDTPLSREEMIGIKVGIDGGKSQQPDRPLMNYKWRFSDNGKIDEKFTGYIANADYSGPQGDNISRPFGKIGTFRPKQAVTRQEAAACLWQYGSGAGTTNIFRFDAQSELMRRGAK